MEKMPSDQKLAIHRFAKLIQDAGYGEGALRLIEEELIPLAKKEGLSLIEAALRYANCDEEQDTSWCQLHDALTRMRKEEVKPFEEIRF